MFIPLLTQEVAAGIAGALIVSFLAFCTSWLRNVYVGRKYPVGGEYVTYFEDVESGQKVVQACISRLKQRGRRLTGTTTLRDGRTWLLDGSIVGIGHVSGIYSAEAIDDEGVGAFYLRASGLVLDGLWSGYDHVNKNVTSGRYVFKRLLKVDVTPLRKSEAPAALGISEKVFGPHYLTEADLNGASGLSVFVATYKGKVVGFAAIENKGSVSGTLHASAKLPRDVAHAENQHVLGIIKTVAVLERLQGHGIGEQLFLAMQRTLQRGGASLIAVPAWEDPNGVHLKGILSGNGYEPFLTCDRYWKDDCDKGTFTCRCRQTRNECVCNLIWHKKAV